MVGSAYDNTMQPPPEQNQGMPPSTSGPVSFDALTNAFKVLQSDFGYWALASLIILAVAGVTYVIAMFIAAALGLGAGLAASASRTSATAAVSLPMMLVGYMLAMVLIIAVSYALFAGYLDVAVRRIGGQKTAINDLFVGFKKVGPLITAGLVIGLCSTIGMYLCVIPGLYLAAAWSLTPLLILRQNLAPFDAMKKSMSLINSSSPVMMVLLLFVASICAELGAIACGIGMLFTFAIYPLTIGFVYRGFFPTE